MIFKIKWWQLMIYETTLLSLGILIGARWSDFFSNYIYLFLLIFALTGGYVVYMLAEQVDVKEK